MALEAGTRRCHQLATPASNLDEAIFAGAGVDGLYEFEGAKAFFAADEGASAGADGFAEVEECALEGDQRDCHRVAGAAGYVGSYRGGVARVVDNVPAG